ncbi:alpha/beta fold hydrolase [Arvimicrobium flavum]|uniref:alpha/beta fold hydrolase n=1 Tax=Arvimicrobium flavum TaxID=3393320 RepID=UPI00237B4D44|nr:alpha/beta hydrolase [Mesorhizobium shangrilense]
MTPIGSIVRDGARLRVDDTGGEGVPVMFQHGLCGDAGQPAELFPEDARLRRITLECRGHGASEAGDTDRFGIATFARDVAAVADMTQSLPLVVGGVSMGAAIALRLAVKRPDLVCGLILVRPAWVTDAAPANMAPNAEVGRLLAALAGDEARKIFLAGETAKRLAAEAPDNLASLAGFFDRPNRAVTAALLQRISADGPGVSEDDLRALRVPTLVIGHGQDFVHPLAHAERLAALVPGSRLVRVTPKAENRARHVADVRDALQNFLKELQ